LAGDIIPFVYEIVDAAGVDDINLPEDSEVYTEPKSGKMHLMKVFSDDSEKEKMRFKASANALVINGIGPAAADMLYTKLHNDIDNLINIVYLMKPDMYRLIYSRLGTSKSTDNIVQGLKDFAQHITLEDVILSFCFKNCGHRASALCAKIMKGEDYSTTNFSKAVYGWAEDPNSDEYRMVMEVVNELNIDMEPQDTSVDSGQIPIIMTGSPKEFGYSTKKDFLNAHPEYVETTNWSECKILFTDDLSSTSSKMKKAAKAGIEVRLYDYDI
jgi:NAD-dependent DNA ligase